MTRRPVSPLRLTGIALLLCSAVTLWWAKRLAFRDSGTRSAPSSPGRAETRQATRSGKDVETLIDSIIALNPFGEVESPGASGAEYRPGGMPMMPMPVSASAPPRLAAIAGPPWSAIMSFDGGAMTVPVSVRDSVRGFRVITISRDYVVLRTRDSTMRVTLSPSRQ